MKIINNHRLAMAAALCGVVVLLVTCTPAPSTPAWALVIAPYVGLAAMLYAAASFASSVLAAVSVRLVEAIGASLMVLDQKAPRDDCLGEICVELEEVNEAYLARIRLKPPTTLPSLASTTPGGQS